MSGRDPWTNACSFTFTSCDGKQVAGICRETWWTWWKACTRIQIWTIDGRKGPAVNVPTPYSKILFLRWAPNSQWLVINGITTSRKWTLWAWKVDSKTLPLAIYDGFTYADNLCWSPNGEHVIIHKPGLIVLVDSQLNTCREIRRYSILNLKWSPDGIKFAAETGHKQVEVWSVAQGQDVSIRQSTFEWSGDSCFIGTRVHNKQVVDTLIDLRTMATVSKVFPALHERRPSNLRCSFKWTPRTHRFLSDNKTRLAFQLLCSLHHWHFPVELTLLLFEIVFSTKTVMYVRDWC